MEILVHLTITLGHGIQLHEDIQLWKGEFTVEEFWTWCKVHIAKGKDALNEVKVVVQSVLDNDTLLQKGTIVDLYQITLELSMEVMSSSVEL